MVIWEFQESHLGGRKAKSFPNHMKGHDSWDVLIWLAWKSGPRKIEKALSLKCLFQPL